MDYMNDQGLKQNIKAIKKFLKIETESVEIYLNFVMSKICWIVIC